MSALELADCFNAYTATAEMSTLWSCLDRAVATNTVLRLVGVPDLLGISDRAGEKRYIPAYSVFRRGNTPPEPITMVGPLAVIDRTDTDMVVEVRSLQDVVELDDEKLLSGYVHRYDEGWQPFSHVLALSKIVELGLANELAS
jgi:hypothetical protein